jgi:tetratricopeptide (TPR) repeat protein
VKRQLRGATPWGKRLKAFILWLLFFFLELETFTVSYALQVPSPSREEQAVLYEAQQFLEEKDFAGAGEVLDAFINERKGDVHYLVTFFLANALARQDKKSEALGLYKKASEQYGGDYAVWINMSWTSFELKHYEEAARYMVKAYEVKKDKDPDLLFQASQCLLMGNMREKALLLLERICSADSGRPKEKWLEVLASVQLELGQTRKAEATLRGLLRKDATKPERWKMVAHVDMERKDYKRAAAAYKMYSTLQEDSGKIGREDLLLLGDLYRLAGVPLKAAQQYERALSWKSTSDAADYEKSSAMYLEAHRPEKAIQLLRKGLEEIPTACLWSMLGSIFYNQERFKEAYEAFEQSFQSSPDDGRAALFMGYCALQMAKTDAAARAFNTAARFDEQRVAALKALKEIAVIAHAVED